MCRTPEFKELLIKNCPNVCGYCVEAEEGCYDLFRSCKTDFCDKADAKEFVTKKCRKTCGFCGQEENNLYEDQNL